MEIWIKKTEQELERPEINVVIQTKIPYPIPIFSMTDMKCLIKSWKNNNKKTMKSILKKYPPEEWIDGFFFILCKIKGNKKLGWKLMKDNIEGVTYVNPTNFILYLEKEWKKIEIKENIIKKIISSNIPLRDIKLHDYIMLMYCYGKIEEIY